VCLQVGRVDHDGLFLAMFGSQADHHPREYAFVDPPLPPAVERLVRSLGIGSVPPAQPIAIDEDNPAQNPPVINPRLAVRLREERGELGHLLVSQPVKVAHVTAPFSEP
jgi:hypothetical protein